VKESFFVEKVLNNNVLIAKHLTYDEVVLIGKGIGFNKKKGDEIDAKAVEKMFLLKSGCRSAARGSRPPEMPRTESVTERGRPRTRSPNSRETA